MHADACWRMLWITRAGLAVDYGPDGPVDYAYWRMLWISQHFVLGRICPLRWGLVLWCRMFVQRTLAEHGDVPVRRSVHDCATRGNPHAVLRRGAPTCSPLHASQMRWLFVGEA